MKSWTSLQQPQTHSKVTQKNSHIICQKLFLSSHLQGPQFSKQALISAYNLLYLNFCTRFTSMSIYFSGLKKHFVHLWHPGHRGCTCNTPAFVSQVEQRVLLVHARARIEVKIHFAPLNQTLTRSD